MLYRCAWCGQDLKKTSLTEPSKDVSHGICMECHKILLVQMKECKHDNLRSMATRTKATLI